MSWAIHVDSMVKKTHVDYTS